MRSDPLDLFAEKQSQVIVQQPSSNGGAGWLVVGLLLGIALFIGYQRFTQDGGGDREQDKQDQREDKKDDDKQVAPKFKGKTLVFVHERNPQSIDHDLLLRRMDGYTKQRGIQYRALDDDLADDQTKASIAFAKSKGVDSPFVILTDADDKPARVIKWPATVDGLGELFR